VRIVRIILRPAKDVDGEWLANVPELGIATQGDGETEALIEACEAIATVVDADIAEGLDPFDRSDA